MKLVVLLAAVTSVHGFASIASAAMEKAEEPNEGSALLTTAVRDKLSDLAIQAAFSVAMNGCATIPAEGVITLACAFNATAGMPTVRVCAPHADGSRNAEHDARHQAWLTWPV